MDETGNGFVIMELIRSRALAVRDARLVTRARGRGRRSLRARLLASAAACALAGGRAGATGGWGPRPAVVAVPSLVGKVGAVPGEIRPAMEAAAPGSGGKAAAPGRRGRRRPPARLVRGPGVVVV